jgi:hypothetical protein
MHFVRFMLLVATAMLVGCGGGGGGGGASPSVGAAPAGPIPLPTSITFNGTQGGADPNHQYVWFTWPVGASFNYIVTSQTGTMFDQTYDLNTWVSPAQGVIDIRPAPPGEAGTFTGTILVNACYFAGGPPCNQIAGTPQAITVTYNVLGLSVTPAQLTFSSADAIPATQTARLAVNGSASSYTTQINYSPSVTDWLQVKPSSGTPDLSNGSQTLTLNVNAAGLPAGVHSAKVTFSAPPSFSTRMTVTFFVGDPSVNFVAPYVVPASGPGDVIIRGRGFSALSPDLSVQFNSTPAPSAVVVSDTEIHATYPALAAGSYSISVSSGATSIPSRAALKLVVIDPPAFPLHTIPRPASAGRPENLIYDAERQALLFVDRTNNRILRYALADSGSTSLDTGLRWVGQIALSPDGTELIRTAPQTPLTRLNPVTLAVLSSVDPSPSFGWGKAAFANDGGLIGGCAWRDPDPKVSFFHALCRYDMLTQTATPVSFQWHLSLRDIVASADGSSLVMPFPGGPMNTDVRVYTYDASTGMVTPRPATTPYFRGLSVSRNHSRTILAHAVSGMPSQTTVYDASFNVLGTLPNDALPYVLSPDGDFAYGYFSQEGRVRKFNVRAARSVTEVGIGSVVAPANTGMSEMTISPDGGTLFLVGMTSVVIAPAP